MKLNENQLRVIIKESVKKILKESFKNNDYTPSVYVGTYKKYNNGSIKGEWVDLTNFDSKEEFIEYCKELHNDEGDAELMFQDWENIPDCFIGESYISEELWDLYINNDDYDYDIKYAIGNEANDASDYESKIQNCYIFYDCNNMTDVAQEYINEIGEIPEYWLNNFIDYEQIGKDCAMDWDDSEGSIYSAYGVDEDNDYELGYAIISEGGIDKQQIEYYIDYEKAGREISMEHSFIRFDRGLIEII